MRTRREFLSSGLLGVAGVALAPRAIAGEELSGLLVSSVPLGKIPVLQGWTTETRTELKILRPLKHDYHYRVTGPSGDRLPLVILDEFNFLITTPYSIDHLEVTGLELGKTYQLTISDDQRVIDEREFSAIDLSAKSARIAILSCMNDLFPISQRAMWASVARSQPDLLLFIGDACYADFMSGSEPQGIWRRHCETRRFLDVYKYKKLIPSLAVWDDHDFGLNDSDGTFRYKEESLIIFEAMFGSKSRDRLKHGPGLGQIAHAFGMRIALMDDRYFRSPPKTHHGTHWGAEQEDFLLEDLHSKTAPTLLCNGSQYYGGYARGESLEYGYAHAFRRFKEQASRIESPILFCSGDVHYSEFMAIEERELGYPTWEITSSSVHSTAPPFRFMLKKNPRRLDATHHHNFVLVETNVEESGSLRFKTRCIGKHGEYFSFQNILKRA